MNPLSAPAYTYPASEHGRSDRPAPGQLARRSRRSLVIAAIVGMGLAFPFLLALLALSALASGSIAVSSVASDGSQHLYTVKIFSAMPADDARLEAWLRAQPGVQTVELDRVSGDRLALHVNYRRSETNDPEGPPSPPWEALGYQLAPSTPRNLDGALPPMAPLAPAPVVP